jgi:hypothetical protein
MSDFKVTRYRVRTGKNGGTLEQPFSAVLLSDLHNVSYGENNSRLLQEIRKEDPKFVLIAGDMLTAGREPRTDAAVALVGELTRRYQVYYGNGNHEHRLKMRPEKYGDCYEKYSNAIKSLGVHLLENGSARLEIYKKSFRIWGLELDGTFFGRGRPTELSASRIEEMLGRPDERCYNILLAHHPAYFDAYADWGADLTLSGHLHGGIVRLPFLGGVISPQLRLFPKYDRGLYERNEKKLIVGAGLGTHTIHLRINNPPELIVIDFV